MPIARIACSFFFVALSLPCFSDEALQTDQTIKDLIQKVRPSIATIKVSSRDGDQLQMGTGFAIGGDLIATNFHVLGEGRSFTVKMASGREVKVLSVEASDRAADLVLIRVKVDDQPLPALTLSKDGVPEQGTSVVTIGSPHGLELSAVAGIVSASREVEGRELIQLAMMFEQGNSGGPLVDMAGNVIGIVNMKSAIDDNLGFAIPVDDLQPLIEKPNPVQIDRWVRLGRIDDQKWTALMGAVWQERGGYITARGVGESFGGRSLCLSTQTLPTERPFEISVQVKLDNEAGAAGIAFGADGKDKHYGFYPTAGRMRLTCFKGPSVYSWQILEDERSKHYLPNQWNHLRVRLEKDRIKCFVNEHLMFESPDQQLNANKFGLVKFRDTNPDFKNFRYGPDIAPKISPEAEAAINKIIGDEMQPLDYSSEMIHELEDSAEIASQKLAQHAAKLEERAARLKVLATDVELAPIVSQLKQLMRENEADPARLLKGTLLIAKLDNLGLNVNAYMERVDQMANEIKEELEPNSNATSRREALHRYLFDQNGFHGGRAEYYHRANSHLDRVIEDREGLPITLSILYMELGRRLDLNIVGVGLPGHFVVKHIDGNNEQLVDVFERGELLSDADAERIVNAYANRVMVEEDLRAQTDFEILSRVINNLIGVASRSQDTEAINRYCNALVALDTTSAEARMMRSQIRALTNRRVQAIADLDWLLENDPPGFDQTRGLQLRAALVEQLPEDDRPN